MASQQGQAQVLQNLGGGWHMCQDVQGIFYYNQDTQESRETPPQAVASPVPAVQAAPAQVMPAQAQQSKIKMTVGDWQICEDAQGEFYAHTPSGQTFDKAPPQLLQLLQTSAQKPPPQAAQQYQAPPAASMAQARIKIDLGEWQICEDAQGEFYKHTPSGQTFDQPPQQLVQLYQSAMQKQQPAAQPPPQPGYAQQCAAQQAQMKVQMQQQQQQLLQQQLLQQQQAQQQQQYVQQMAQIQQQYQAPQYYNPASAQQFR